MVLRCDYSTEACVQLHEFGTVLFCTVVVRALRVEIHRELHLRKCMCAVCVQDYENIEYPTPSRKLNPLPWRDGEMPLKGRPQCLQLQV